MKINYLHAGAGGHHLDNGTVRILFKVF